MILALPRPDVRNLVSMMKFGNRGFMGGEMLARND